jgi:hypothetical protein
MQSEMEDQKFRQEMMDMKLDLLFDIERLQQHVIFLDSPYPAYHNYKGSQTFSLTRHILHITITREAKPTTGSPIQISSYILFKCLFSLGIIFFLL